MIQKNRDEIFMRPSELKEIISEMGLTVAEFADSVGLGRVSIYNMLAGRRWITKQNCIMFNCIYALWKVDPSNVVLPLVIFDGVVRK